MSSSARHKGKSSTTRLPAALRDELGLGGEGPSAGGEQQGESGGDGQRRRRERALLYASKQGSSSRKGRQSSILGRKEARKAQRQEKKLSRNQHRAPQPHHEQRVARPTRDISNTEHKGRASGSSDRPHLHSVAHDAKDAPRTEKRQSRTPLERLLEQQKGKGKAADNDVASADVKGKRKAYDVQANSSVKRQKASLSAAERNEEDEIAWLEAHLGVRKTKKVKGASSSGIGFTEGQEDDGLDDLLDDLDRFRPGMYDGDAGYGEDEYDDDEEDDTEGEEEEEEDDMEEASDEEEDLDGEESASHLATEDESEVSEDPSESKSDVDIAEEQRSHRDSEKVSQDQLALKATANASSGRYIPPALRKAMNADGAPGDVSENEEVQKIKRSAKGILNRLGDNNIGAIILEIEALYRQYSRAQTTTCLTNLVLDTIVTGGENINRSLIVLYGALVSALHRIVGVEFGAHFVQELTNRFLQHYKSDLTRQTSSNANVDETEATQDIPTDKGSRNLVSLLASIYNLEVISCLLVYDVVRLFLGVTEVANIDEIFRHRQMSELDVELLLLIVKTCGSQLRHDDSTSLKAIVQLAQERTKGDSNSRQESHQQPISMRAKFMLESMNDLSTNRSRTTTANAEAEMLVKMRKLLSGLSKKHTIRTSEPLRVTLKDLCDVEKRGKWWLVGAAWSGYDFSDKKESDKTGAADIKGTQKAAANVDAAMEKNLQTLARQHGMNTALRQQIFVNLLSSEDYLDAVQRLLALTHKKPTQRREIIRVLLHCLSIEPSFNPFYVVVVGRLANEDSTSTRITLQYSLWDFLRRIGERDVGGQSIVGSLSSKDDDDEDEDELSTFDASASKKKLTSAQVSNVARAYGWWLAKGALTLDALRAIDFTTIKAARLFLQLVFVHLFLSVNVKSPVQTLSGGGHKVSRSSLASQDAASAKLHDEETRTSVETVFVRGTRSSQRVAQGLVIFFETHLRKANIEALVQELGVRRGSDVERSVLRARAIALETVRIGSRVAANNDMDL